MYGVNLFYRIAPNVLLGAEISQFRTLYIGVGTRLTNHYDLGAGLIFSQYRSSWFPGRPRRNGYRAGRADQFPRPRRAPPQRLFGSCVMA